MRIPLHLALLVLLVFIGLSAGCSATPPRPFDQQAPVQAFITQMVQEHQFKAEELDKLFAQAKLRPDILRAISRPAEAKPWYDYRPIFVNASRIRDGVAFWQRNADAVARASKTYGVPPEILVAIIGVETRYGKHTGGYRVIDALSTLAFAYPPRSAFFTRELEQFLLMTREEHLDPLSLKGSYAGAMGQPQFIASSFRHYAVDFDGDGVRDLWHNPADALGSVGNYFRQHGWVSGAPVISPARVSGTTYRELLGDLKPQWTAADFSSHGVQIDGPAPASGSEPGSEARGTLIVLDTDEDEQGYWVGWQNFYVITRYNHSPLYAMAVYQLAQAIRERMQDTNGAQ